MSLQEYFNEMKSIHELILQLIENEDNNQEFFQKLNKLLDDSKFQENKYKFRSLLYLLIKIVDNHHRSPTFFNQIEIILKLYKSEIQKHFSNSEIFRIFKTNKRILLFLIEEKILIIDQNIANKILNIANEKAKYPQYFYPEIEQFISDKTKICFDDENESENHNNSIQLPKNFHENRKIGENEKKISKLVRNDSIEDFIIYVNQKNIPLSSSIKRDYFNLIFWSHHFFDFLSLFFF